MTGGVLDKVDQRTRLVGQNRLELLTFRLNGRQRFAINVFKVQEVIAVPTLTVIPHSHPNIIGVAHLRGSTIPVIDLSRAVGRSEIKRTERSSLIVTEYNRSVQAFLVGAVDNIVNLNWEDILPPPAAAGTHHYLTAITRINEEIVEIIDVEKVLAEVVPFNSHVSKEVLDQDLATQAAGMEILAVDDSTTALSQVRETIAQLGIKLHTESDGARALHRLQNWAAEGDVTQRLLMVITDAEMPEMDGYRLTAEIRADARLRDLYVCLHTSLSGSFNEAMVKTVGCDAFLSKFAPDDLARLVQQRIRERLADAKRI